MSEQAPKPFDWRSGTSFLGGAGVVTTGGALAAGADHPFAWVAGLLVSFLFLFGSLYFRLREEQRIDFQVLMEKQERRNDDQEDRIRELEKRLENTSGELLLFKAENLALKSNIEQLQAIIIDLKSEIKRLHDLQPPDHNFD